MGIWMRRLLVAVSLVVTGLVWGAAIPSASAADKAVELRPRDGTYIKMRHARRFLRCPDAYSCYPLYGAYGPYGGHAYWDAYSAYVPPEYR
ncbi:hypothetical protein SAMN05216525_10443 [Bradyrhizobium sp. Gha]|nr:hypothetical protein SAMN05216525_10443 [Bradyrhizobium sp. Gha]